MDAWTQQFLSQTARELAAHEGSPQIATVFDQARARDVGVRIVDRSGHRCAAMDPDVPSGAIYF